MRFSLPRVGNPLRSSRFKPLLDMTVPVMAEQAFITLMGIVNAGMAGRAGTAIAGGVSLVTPLNNLLISVFTSLALGVTVAVSRARGEGNEERVRLAGAQGLRLCLSVSAAISLVLFLFPGPLVNLLFGASGEEVRQNAISYLRWISVGYPLQAASLAASGILRGVGDARTPMAANILMNFFNAIFGRIFIFGIALGGRELVPALGASGAAIAIDLARLIGFAIYIAVLYGFSRSIHLKLRDLVLREAESRNIMLKVAIPSTIEALAFNGGKLLTQTYVAGLGAAALSADYIANAVVSLEQVPVSSLNMAVPPLVAHALGRKDREEARETVKVAVVFGSFVMLALAVPSFIFARPLMALSTTDPEVIRQGAALFRIFCLSAPFFWSLSFVVPGGLRGAGDGKFTMIVALLSMWLVRVVLGWVFAIPLGLGILGVWMAMIIDWIVRGAFFSLRMRGSRWIKL